MTRDQPLTFATVVIGGQLIGRPIVSGEDGRSSNDEAVAAPEAPADCVGSSSTSSTAPPTGYPQSFLSVAPRQSLGATGNFRLSTAGPGDAWLALPRVWRGGSGPAIYPARGIGNRPFRRRIHRVNRTTYGACESARGGLEKFPQRDVHGLGFAFHDSDHGAARPLWRPPSSAISSAIRRRRARRAMCREASRRSRLSVAPADVDRGRNIQSGATVLARNPVIWVNPDLPPAQPLAPGADEPAAVESATRRRGGIQSNELAPPPGAAPSQDLDTDDAGRTQRAGRPAAAEQRDHQSGPAAVRPAAGGSSAARYATAATAGRCRSPSRAMKWWSNRRRSASPIRPRCFAGLDKITGRITKFDVAINETVQFGALQRDAACLLFTAADRNAEHGSPLSRLTRSTLQRRDQTHLFRLDVRGQPRSARHRASDL